VRPLVADTGGLLRALARAPDERAAWPQYQVAIASASVVIVPALILPEVDHSLREGMHYHEKARGRDPRSTGAIRTRATPADLSRAIEIDSRFSNPDLGLVNGTVAAVAGDP
jgi:hypothetical protein